MKSIMIVGASSHAGKTTLVAGLCRLFANRGLKVAPLKSQNMSLNCYVTEKGEEIARSTAVQAFAARTVPNIHMNPVLIKPKNDLESQVILHGKVTGEASAKEIFKSEEWFLRKQKAIEESIDYLKSHYDLIVAEGAGSCAEPNFRENDLVNMGLAEKLDAEVYLVVDIDKGGVFADILGTLKIMELTHPRDIRRLKGVLINKFRGDPEILKPAIEFIEKQTGLPVAGIIPFMPDLLLEEEDRVKVATCLNPEIDIAVVYLPHISNISDFNPLSIEENVRVRFVRSPEALGAPDAIIVPGTKSTIWDMTYAEKIGWDKALQSQASIIPIVGLCGGYEMFGKSLKDPHQIESSIQEKKGWGFFDFEVTFLKEKKIAQVTYAPGPANPFKTGDISGYEIHCGVLDSLKNFPALFESSTNKEGQIRQDSSHVLVMGTFIHDIFKNGAFTRAFINYLRERKGLEPLDSNLIDSTESFEININKLSDVLRLNINNL